MSGAQFQRRLSMALFSPGKAEGQEEGSSTMSPRATINHILRSPRNSTGDSTADSSKDQYLASFRSKDRRTTTPNSRNSRRGSQFQRSEVLSTTRASKVASEHQHDNVDAMELTACVDALELSTEKLLPIFEFYCSYGDSYNLELLKITNFARFVRDTKMLPTKFPIGELQILFVRSTRAVTAEAQKSDEMDKRGENAGKVHDSTCLTYVNWLEAICRVANLRVERRRKRQLQQIKKQQEEDNNNQVSSPSNEKDNDAEEDQFETSLSDEVDTILEKNILQYASRLETLAEASELLEPSVTEVIRSDLPNLEVMFAFYSDAQKDEEALIGEIELKKFCTDFGLMPKLISKLELFRIFRKVSNGRFNLGFPDFIECVGRLALTAFNKPFFETAYPTNPEKVAGFLQWLEDSGYQRKIIEHDRLHGHGYRGRRLSSPQLLGTRASGGNGLKPSQAMLRRLTSQENRQDVSAATKRRAHDEAFAFQVHAGRGGVGGGRGRGNTSKWAGKSSRSGLRGLGRQGMTSSNATAAAAAAVAADNNEENDIKLTRMSSSVKMNAKEAESTQRNSKLARHDSHLSSLRFDELANLTGTDRPREGTRRDLSSLSGDDRDLIHQGQKGWNADVKHVMRSEIATSVFSPHWGEERNLVRSVAALSPYRDALHEVFEYYCFYNNRRTLNFTQLNATNWARLCRDCHLVLDPRGITMNKEDALHAMEQSGCWVTPGEVDVIFVRSATADTHISGLDHGVLSFDTFQLALARLVRIIDSRAGVNLRKYRHEFSSFEDTRTVDHLYYDGDAQGDTKNSAEDSNEGGNHHTSLSISSIIRDQVKDANKKDSNMLDAVTEVDEDDDDDEDDEDDGKSNGNGNNAEETKKNRNNQSPTNLDDKPARIDELLPSEIDEYLLRRSVAAVDSGGAMTYVHMYDEHKANVLDLGEALALVTARCILPHARRITCDGYGHKEALKYVRMLASQPVIDIIHEEHQFTERMFMFYADIRDSKLPGFTPASERFTAVTFHELTELARDFGLTPSLTTQTEMFMCFRSCRRNPSKSIQNSTMLSYPEFVEYLARLALLSFSKPYLSKHHPKPQHKIHGFFGWCRASDGLKRIGAIEWSRGHSRAGLHMTRGLLSGTSQVDPHSLLKTPTDSIKHNNKYDRIDHTMNIIRKCSKEQIGRHFDLSTLFNHVDSDGSGSIDVRPLVVIVHFFNDC